VATAVGVYVVPSPHGRAVRLTLTPPAGGLAWSPDGARLAFSSADPGDPASLSVLNATSGEGVSYRSFAPGFQDAVGTPAWRPLA
jgi:Tol biopolymer transport system component